MKIYLLLLSILGLSVLTSCIEDLIDNDPPKTELEKLPPLTTTGENTFGCLVNGMAFKTKGSLYVTAIYQRGFLQLHGGGVGIVIIDSFEVDESYLVTDTLKSKARYTLELGNNGFCFYKFSDVFSGSVKLINLDRTKYIVSGIFEFSTVTDQCDTINVTDGRFDLKYIP